MSALNKYREYTTSTGGVKYTDAELDRILEAVLPLNTRALYEQACNAIAKHLARGHRQTTIGRTNSQFIDRLLWGLATRYREYTGPAAPDSRALREGCLTYTEKLIIKWAVNSNSAVAIRARQKRGAGRPTAAYIARLLGRREATVAVAMRNAGPAHGRPGLVED